MFWRKICCSFPHYLLLKEELPEIKCKFLLHAKKSPNLQQTNQNLQITTTKEGADKFLGHEVAFLWLLLRKCPINSVTLLEYVMPVKSKKDKKYLSFQVISSSLSINKTKKLVKVHFHHKFILIISLNINIYLICIFNDRCLLFWWLLFQCTIDEIDRGFEL